MKTEFEDLVDINDLQVLCERFSELFGAATAILNLDGDVLIAAGWQRACTQFHRTNPITSARCLESDTALAGQLEMGEDYNVYCCKNGLVDVAVPIKIDGEHVANLFTGQFFFEQPKLDLFALQAEQVGFNQADYLQAISDVSIYSEQRVKSMMVFLCSMAEIIASIGKSNRMLTEINSELDAQKAKLQSALNSVAESENQLRTILDSLDACVYLKGKDGQYRFINWRMANMLGVNVTSGHGIRFIKLDRLLESLIEGLNEHDDEVLNGKGMSAEEYVATDGRVFLVTKVPLIDQNREIYAYCGVLLDVTLQKQNEREIEQSHKLLDTVINNIPSMVILKDEVTNEYRLFNAAVEDKFHIPRAVREHPEEVGPYLSNLEKSWGAFDDIQQTQATALLEIPEHEVEIRGEVRTLNTKKVAIDEDGNGKTDLNLYVAYDITERKRTEDELEHKALYDSLTDLPNRHLLNDRLQHEINLAKRQQKKIGYLFIDLDHFKDINDTSGHDVGDLVIQEAARRIKSCVREYDIVSRFGGDEFIVVISCYDDESTPGRIANDINEALSIPMVIGKERYFISASIGISIYPDDAEKPLELLKCADQAMYEAKNKGRGRYHYFTHLMQYEADYKSDLVNNLRDAIKAQKLELYYQPIVDLKSKKIVKAEALLRWHDEQFGWVSPAVCIPIAEQTGLIHDIGIWVCETALKQARAWSEKVGSTFKISVNKSPAEFRNAKSRRGWHELIDELDANGEYLCVEITEGLLIKHEPEVIKTLEEYKKRNVEISLDDFGTGYSSLSYLTQFDIDTLKIDRSFIERLTPDTREFALCEAIIVMANKLGLEVVAEGIEDENQLKLITKMGCHYGQGYYFSRPCKADEFEKLLNKK